jgi:hypothetical protein
MVGAAHGSQRLWRRAIKTDKREIKIKLFISPWTEKSVVPELLSRADVGLDLPVHSIQAVDRGAGAVELHCLHCGVY